jgi:hypothetical protein
MRRPYDAGAPGDGIGHRQVRLGRDQAPQRRGADSRRLVGEDRRGNARLSRPAQRAAHHFGQIVPPGDCLAMPAGVVAHDRDQIGVVEHRAYGKEGAGDLGLVDGEGQRDVARQRRLRLERFGEQAADDDLGIEAQAADRFFGVASRRIVEHAAAIAAGDAFGTFCPHRPTRRVDSGDQLVTRHFLDSTHSDSDGIVRSLAEFLAYRS